MPLLTYLLLTLGLLYAAARECLLSDSRQGECLSFATPLMEGVVAVEQYARELLRANYVLTGVQGAGLILLIGIISLLVCRREENAAIRLREFAAVSLCVIGQGYFFDRQFTPGVQLYLVGCCLLVPSLFIQDMRSEVRVSSHPFGWGEFFALFGLTALVLLSRMYALNQLPSGWDDELCFSRIMSFQPQCALRANFGLERSASSNGSLWVFLHWALVHFFGASLLWERMLSMTIGVASFVAMYFFSRSLVGALGAFIAAGLFAFSPLEAGWARLPTLHHLPGLFAIFVMWSAAATIEKRTQTAVVLLMVLTLLTAGLYPSGQLLGVAALGVVAIHWLFNFRSWRGHHFKMLLLVAGGVGWVVHDSLLKSAVAGQLLWDTPGPGHYEVTSPEMLGDSALGNPKIAVVFKVWTESVSFLSQLYWEPIRSWSHWSPLASIDPASWLSWISLALLPLGVVTLVRRLRWSLLGLFTAWFISGLLPAVLSQVADRRIGSITPLLALLPAIAILHLFPRASAAGRRGLSAALRFTAGILVVGSSFFIHTGEFFSERRGTPFIEGLAREIAALIERPTLVVPLMAGSLQCQLFYSLYEQSLASQGDIGWNFPDLENPALMHLPLEVAVTGNSLYYQCTALNASNHFKPERILYVGRGSPGGVLDGYVREWWPGVSIEAKRVCERVPECEFWAGTIEVASNEGEKGASPE